MLPSPVNGSSHDNKVDDIKRGLIQHGSRSIDLHISWKSLSLLNPSFRSEAKALMSLALPMGFSLATRILQYLTDQSMVGHLGTDFLAASSMANVLMTISGTYIYAFCGTINVLCSQAMGARSNSDPKLVSEWAQLGCVLAAILTAPAFISYFYCEEILTLFGATPHIASLAGQFARWSMISILPNSQFMAVRMYFKAQSNVLPATTICAVMVLFNVAVNLVLVYGFGVSWILTLCGSEPWNGLGFIGSPIATAITRSVQFTIYMIYMFVYRRYHITSGTWSPLKASTFSVERMAKFAKVAIPQTISSALEDWQIQIIALFASRLDEADLAAFSSSVTIILVCHTLSIGLADAASVRVGNQLGANHPRSAKYIAWVTIVLGSLVGVGVGGTLAIFGKYLAYVVSGSNEIYVIYEEVFPVVGASLFLLSVFTVIIGVLQAQARTIGLAISALIGCWGISVPFSYLMGLHWNLGILGIWGGIIAGYTVFASSTIVIFLRSDWIQCAKDAVERNGKRVSPEKVDKSKPSIAIPKDKEDHGNNELNSSLLEEEQSNGKVNE